MRAISKGHEPKELTEYRLGTPDASYSGGPKEAIREALVGEQHGLCCYCMGRIRASSDGMKIEHLNPQSAGSGDELTWRNLLGSCQGGMGRPPELQHCDTAKGGQPITVPLLDGNLNHRVRYSAQGEISSRRAAESKDMNEVLHLNLESLKTRRKSALSGMVQAWSVQKAGAWSPAVLSSRRDALLDASRKAWRPDVGILVYFLEKRMGR